MYHRTLTLLILCFWGVTPHAHSSDNPFIAIIIDDIGYRSKADKEAMDLPGNITYGIMPHSPNAEYMSQVARQKGKQVIVHLSMQPVSHDKHNLMGPGALMLNMDRGEFLDTLSINLGNLPDAVGVNNHMGSLLTQSRSHMKWLMEYLKPRTLFYLDSVTIGRSVVQTIASEQKTPYIRRDVFLDNKRDNDYIQGQFNQLIKLSRLKGYAIAIGHPHPETIEVLGSNLAKLETLNVDLVSLTDIINRKTQRADSVFLVYSDK